MALLSSKTVPLGTPAPDFNLKGIDGEMHSLSSYSAAEILVMVFMCNHCPYVQKIWDDLTALDERMPPAVQFVGINVNGGNAAYPEDSFEKMKEYAELHLQKFPYLIDEDQKVAQAYEAVCTPDIFVYDKERLLVYHGAFSGLAPIFPKLLAGEMLASDQEHSMGCSIKWNA